METMAVNPTAAADGVFDTIRYPKRSVHSVSKDESGTFNHMATAHIKATVKGHEANRISYLCWRSKEFVSVLCSVFQTIDLPQYFAQGPLLQNHDRPSVRTKEPSQAAYRIIHRLQSTTTGLQFPPGIGTSAQPRKRLLPCFRGPLFLGPFFSFFFVFS